jgi:hypothetical protein
MGSVMIDVQIGGLIGLIILIADIYAIIKIVQSSATTGAKVLWTVVILIFPLVGLLLWLLLGPKDRSALA